MKKLISISIFAVSIVSFAGTVHSAHAANNVGDSNGNAGSFCVPGVANACNPGLTCDPTTNVCVGNNAAPNNSGDSNGAAGAYCVPGVANACAPGLTCDKTFNVCIDNTGTTPTQPKSNAPPAKSPNPAPTPGSPAPAGPSGPQGFVPLASIPGLTANYSNVTSDTIVKFLDNLYNFMIGIAAVLAVVQIIWGGLEIATQDSVSKNRDGKARITQALLGLVLVLAPYLVFYIINPQILNFSLNSFKPLTLPTSSGTGSGQSNLNQAPGGNPGSGTPPANGCNTPTGGSEYQTVSCGSDQAAQDYLTQHCPNNGTVSTGTRTSGYNPDGSCSSGQYPSVTCNNPSSQTFTFVDLDSGDQEASVRVLPTDRLLPVNSSTGGVDAFINACSTQTECFPSAGGGSVGGGSGPADQGVCPSGSYSFKTKYSNPHCYASTLICSDSSHAGCSPNFILCGSTSASGCNPLQ